jgi:FMN phosphatase YigB (HAD superfamily)
MKKITTVLFDLDGTLIGMDQDEFIRLYFEILLDKLAELGYAKDTMYDVLERCIFVTKRNDGRCTNEERFWQTFNELTEGFNEKLGDALMEFYRNDFAKVLEGSCTPYPRANEVLECARRKGLRLILATNPLFPAVATYARIRLGGMLPEDFEYITAYENSSYCKPNPDYFTELLAKLGVSPEECVMIGNDTRDDFSAHALGIPVFVNTEGLINRDNVDLSLYPHGGFDELISYIESL